MSHALPDHEAVLRRILHAAAEQIEPSADGLERIQARLTNPRPVPLAWICAIATRLSLRIPPGLRPAIDRILLEIRLATEHFMPAPANRPRGRGSQGRLGWLRPFAAMGTAVFIVAAVVYISIDVTQVISPTGSDATAQHTGHSGAPGGASGGTGQSYSSGSGPVSSPGTSGGLFNSTPACATPGPGKSTILPPPASSSPTKTASPTPTATPTPTPTSTATPTPTSTETGSPGTGSGTGSSPSPASDVTANPQAGTSQPGSSAPATTTDVAATTGRQDTAASPAASPCASPKSHKKKKTSSRTVTPDATGAAGLMVAPELTGARAPAEVKGQLS